MAGKYSLLRRDRSKGIWLFIKIVCVRQVNLDVSSFLVVHIEFILSRHISHLWIIKLIFSLLMRTALATVGGRASGSRTLAPSSSPAPTLSTTLLGQLLIDFLLAAHHGNLLLQVEGHPTWHVYELVLLVMCSCCVPPTPSSSS